MASGDQRERRLRPLRRPIARGQTLDVALGVRRRCVAHWADRSPASGPGQPPVLREQLVRRIVGPDALITPLVAEGGRGPPRIPVGRSASRLRLLRHQGELMEPRLRSLSSTRRARSAVRAGRSPYRAKPALSHQATDRGQHLDPDVLRYVARRHHHHGLLGLRVHGRLAVRDVPRSSSVMVDRTASAARRSRSGSRLGRPPARSPGRCRGPLESWSDGSTGVDGFRRPVRDGVRSGQRVWSRRAGGRRG